MTFFRHSVAATAGLILMLCAVAGSAQASSQVQHMTLAQAREACFKMATRPSQWRGNEVTVKARPNAAHEDCTVHLLFRPHTVPNVPAAWRDATSLRPLFDMNGYLEVRGESGRISTFALAQPPRGVASYWTSNGDLMVVIGQELLFDGEGHPASVKVYTLAWENGREWLFHGDRILVEAGAANSQSQTEAWTGPLRFDLNGAAGASDQ